MNTSSLIEIFGIIAVLTLLLRVLLQPHIRRISAVKRCAIVTFLLVVGLSVDITALVIAAARDQIGIAMLLLVSALFICLGSAAEMRKLR